MTEHFIRNIEIKNFKLFEDFKAKDFGRVNLIGGKNNVGKTAFMEACYLSQSESIEELFARLLEIETHRDVINNLLNKSDREEDLRRLIKSNTDIEIKAPTKISRSVVAGTTIRVSSDTIGGKINTSSNDGYQKYYKWTRGLVSIKLNKQLLVNLRDKCYKHTLNDNTKFNNQLFPTNNQEQWFSCDGSEVYEIKTLIDRLDFHIDNTKVKFSINYISNFSNSNKELENIIGDLKLNKRYTQLNSYLKNVFDIDAIDIIKDKPMLEVKGRYLELSKFGQGVKSFINIIVSLLLLENSYLFIDELENGIHYTNLDKLWEIILTISKEQNVQVFATTHSKECIGSYARVAKKLKDEEVSFMSLYKSEENIEAIVLESKTFLERVALGLEHR